MPSQVAVYLRRPGDGWPVDNGDDPSFEYAAAATGPVTWGVCRPDARNAVSVGDVVVFFAADSLRDRKPARYVWVGFELVAMIGCHLRRSRPSPSAEARRRRPWSRSR
ncbi:MAG: hypothetical protein ABTD50_24750, partial [Polyangiaceae bacterium]